jgi:hypothetical protein
MAFVKFTTGNDVIIAAKYILFFGAAPCLLDLPFNCYSRPKSDPRFSNYFAAWRSDAEYCGYNDKQFLIARFIVSRDALDLPEFHPVCA